MNSGSYADYYERVKFLAGEKKWNQAKINDMLSDKKKFEREWNLVSKFISNLYILMTILQYYQKEKNKAGDVY